MEASAPELRRFGIDDEGVERLARALQLGACTSPARLRDLLARAADPAMALAGWERLLEVTADPVALGALGAEELLAAINVSRLVKGAECIVPPATTALGSLLRYVTDRNRLDFQPMNANYGLFTPLTGSERGRDKRRAFAGRAVSDLRAWMTAHQIEPPQLVGDQAFPA